MLRSLRSLSLVLAVASLLAPAVANAAPTATSSTKKSSTKKSTTKKSAKKKATKKAKTPKYPSVSKVSPMKVGIGDKLVVKGKGFRAGKGKDFVVFKRDGGKALFVKVDKATTTQMTVTVPAKLLTYFLQANGAPKATRFRLRAMATRLAEHYTKNSLSPLVSPVAGTAAGDKSDCDGDGILNGKDPDDDNDLISDTKEAADGTDPCKRDSDGDGMSDGWEIQSATDRNGGTYPKAKPSPNPLAADAEVDADGDGLTNLEEYAAWATFGGDTFPLSYSGGNVASAGRGGVPPVLKYMDRDGNGFLSDLERDADGDGIPNVDETRGDLAGTSLAQARLITTQADSDGGFYDYGIFTPAYLNLAAKQARQDPLKCGGINQVPFYCNDKITGGAGGVIDVQKVDTLDWLSADSDGDGIPDAADDVDHDGISNGAEYLGMIAAPFKARKLAPLDACVPSYDNAACLIGASDMDGDGLVNAVDTDDDGDGLTDVEEAGLGTNPLAFDTDGDGVSDGFEYFSAKDLNRANLPYPGKRPYPNPLDGTDADSDFDGDSLSQLDEFHAWLYTSCGGHVTDASYANCHLIFPLTYSDGTQKTDGVTSDAYRDVDSDGLVNWVEDNGPLSGPGWWDKYINSVGVKCDSTYVESTYAGPAYLGLNFTDPDTDGDGVLDGADDVDHDGYTNLQESTRPGLFASPSGNWCVTYRSEMSLDGTHGHPAGADPLARMQPFNPCKPTYSSYCHNPRPIGAYPGAEDWASPDPQDGP
jgi:hypothetical protein